MIHTHHMYIVCVGGKRLQSVENPIGYLTSILKISSKDIDYNYSFLFTGPPNLA